MSSTDFSDGLMAGFSALETIRDRNLARQNEARRMNLAEIASNRAETAQQSDLAQINRKNQFEDQDRATGQARARVLADPNNINPADLEILKNGRDAETLAAVEAYRGKAQVYGRTLGELAARGAQAPQAAAPTAPGQAPQAGPAAFSDAQNAFLQPDGETSLPGTQFPQTRRLAYEDVKDFLSPDDPTHRAAGVRGKAGPGARSGAVVEVPPDVLSAREIASMPVPEQEAARARNKELLGNRVSQIETLRKTNPDGAGQKALNDRYLTFLDAGKDSPMRQVATATPTAWIEQYRNDRASLDPNTRALVDAKAVDVAHQSLSNLTENVTQIPRDASGAPNLTSPEGIAYKRNLEHNIAVLSAAEKDFSPAKAAQIRGGYMPVGNQQLADRVTAAWQAQPMPAKPATQHEERLMATQAARLAEQSAQPGGIKKVSAATVDMLGKAVARGWVDYKDAESLILTGRITPQTFQFFQSSPKEDLFLNGQLIRRGYDPEAIGKVQREADKDMLGYVDKYFENAYPNNKEEAARRRGQFLTQMYQQRDTVMEQHGFDPLHADIPHIAAMANHFTATDVATSAWDKSLLGARPWLFGEYQEQAGPYTNAQSELNREWTPDNYGVYNLGDRKFQSGLARQRLMQSGDPRDRAAVFATQGNDAALYQYWQERTKGK